MRGLLRSVFATAFTVRAATAFLLRSRGSKFQTQKQEPNVEAKDQRYGDVVVGATLVEMMANAAAKSAEERSKQPANEHVEPSDTDCPRAWQANEAWRDPLGQ